MTVYEGYAGVYNNKYQCYEECYVIVSHDRLCKHHGCKNITSWKSDYCRLHAHLDRKDRKRYDYSALRFLNQLRNKELPP